MGVDMSTNPPPNPHPFVPSPALSLTLAGIFRWGADVDGGDDAVEVTSENSGPARSRSDHEEMVHHIADVDEGDDDGGDDSGDEMKGKTNKRRKKSHRHSADQIREMEALFKESPHPDEKQRQQLSKQLGLHPRQVKFWFQNRRTQNKAIQERHENSLLKTQLEKLKHENKSLRDTIQRGGCPNCGFAVGGTGSSKEMINIAVGDDQQQLKIENSRLKVEVERLKAMVSKAPAASSSPTASSKATNDQHDRSCLDSYTGSFGIEKSKIMDIVDKALEELKKMATSGEPLWLRSIETGREILNYDHYIKEFSVGCSNDQPTTRSIEASRESRVVFVDLPRLVQSFMDVNQWREMFPFLISKAAMVDVINVGEGPNRNGAVQLIFAELQMLTPMVPTREVYFVRYCKRLSLEKWAIVDVSIDKIEDSIDASLVRCRKRPSGCIIEDTSNGNCKVTWVEHLECQKVTVHSMYRTIVNSGLAFGASHWMATLQLQCEHLAFLIATNVPTKDSSGVGTLAGRKSVLKLAQRMTWSFCQAVGASSFNSWTKMTTKTGEDIRVASRKNLNDPGEPIGTIICAVSSAWLPVSPSVLFNFLRDESLRHKWDVMASKSQVQSIANLAKGQDRGNAVCIQMMNSNENTIWVLQDSCTNSYESLVVYSPVDISGMESVMTGCDSSNVVVLPSGFSILSDGMESRPLVLMSRQEDTNAEGGSLLTIALQAITNNSSATKVAVESVEPVSTLISCILQNIRTSLQCEDG